MKVQVIGPPDGTGVGTPVGTFTGTEFKQQVTSEGYNSQPVAPFAFVFHVLLEHDFVVSRQIPALPCQLQAGVVQQYWLLAAALQPVEP